MALSKGIRIHVYLDDWLIWADSPEGAERASQEMVSLVTSLSWIINHKKSELNPTQTFNFVGYQYDLSRALMRPTQDRWSKLQSVISLANSKNAITARELMSLLGLLASTEKMVPLGGLHMRPLQWHLKRHWHVPMSLNRPLAWINHSKRASSWWTDRRRPGVSIRRLVHQRTLVQPKESYTSMCLSSKQCSLPSNTSGTSVPTRK